MKRITWLVCVALLLLWAPLPAAAGAPPPACAWQIDRSCGAACRVTLHAIDMVSADDGWAVGEGGAILRWDGDRWQRFDSPTTLSLLAVDMVSATDGWAVGGDTGYIWTHGVILRWNGSVWQVFATPSIRLQTLSMSGAEDGWAGGYRYLPYGNSWDQLLRWDGANWQLFADDMGEEIDPWASVSTAGPDRGWLATMTWYASPKLLQWDGARWGYGEAAWVESPIETAALVADAQGGGWAVGSGILDLATLEVRPETPPARLNAVAAVAADDVWAVGEGGIIYHWDGAEWRGAASPTAAPLRGVAMVSATDGWAVGADGVILRYTDGPPAPPPVYLPLLVRG